MSEPARKIDPKPEAKTVVQYWVAERVDIFRQGAHVYEINGVNYAVVAYPTDPKFARAICNSDRVILKIEVHNYRKEDNLSHKNDYTFLAIIFPAPKKRL